MSVLREITQEKHTTVENLPLIQCLLNGEITKEQYVVYLGEMHAIYHVLEDLAQQQGLFKGLEELPRADLIYQDLVELDPNFRVELTTAAKKYLQYLDNLVRSARAEQLFAHVYVRHLGDLYGGKLISRRVPGAGNWYQFENRSELAKRFNERITLDLADEALVAFDFYMDIFQDLWTRLHTA